MRPRIDRLNRGETVAALAALALLVLSFLPWFGAEVQANGAAIEGSGVDGSAWQALGLVPYLLAAAALAAWAAAALRLFAPRYDPPLPPSALVAVLGGLAALAILLRLVFPPSEAFGGVTVEATLRLPAFLALLAAAALASGGYAAMRARGFGFGDVAERLERSAARGAPPSPRRRSRRRDAAPPASRRRSRSSSD